MKTRELKSPSDSLGVITVATRRKPSGGDFFVPMKNRKAVAPIGAKTPASPAATKRTREPRVTVHELDHETGKIIGRWRWPKSTVDAANDMAEKEGITFEEVVRRAVREARYPKFPKEMAGFIKKYAGRKVAGELMLATPLSIVNSLNEAFQVRMLDDDLPTQIERKLCMAFAAKAICDQGKAAKA